jgi:hypothetical protein
LSRDKRYPNAAREGRKFLIAAQLPEPQAGWAQQYNFDMEPAGARPFELPAVVSRESAGAVRTLLVLYIETGEERFIEPIPAFIDWIGDSAIGPDTWARYYELGTNEPIYGDDEGQIHYALQEVRDAVVRTYGWEGNFGVANTIAFYKAVLEEGHQAFHERERPGRIPTAREVEAILAAQDGDGGWLTDGEIEIATFAGNMVALAAYLRDQ